MIIGRIASNLSLNPRNKKQGPTLLSYSTMSSPCYPKIKNRLNHRSLSKFAALWYSFSWMNLTWWLELSLTRTRIRQHTQSAEMIGPFWCSCTRITCQSVPIGKKFPDIVARLARVSDDSTTATHARSSTINSYYSWMDLRCFSTRQLVKGTRYPR